jgi:uncharacterized membrane protein YqiK
MTEAASTRLTGVPALIIIVLILAVIIVGLFTSVRFMIRKGRGE